MGQVKKCTKCCVIKELTDFVPDKRRKDGRGSNCRSCHKTMPSMLPKTRISNKCKMCGSYINEGRIDKEYCTDDCGKTYRNRKYSLKRYGVSIDDYLYKLMEQEFACAICGSKETSKKKYLCLDHCHSTNKPRGLLCHKCNSALGLFLDDPKILNNAILYLQEYGVNNVDVS